MVLVCRWALSTVTDLVELVSIHYAYKRVGGPIVDLTTADYRLLQSGHKLYIVGHGAAGQVGAISAADLAKALTKGPKPLRKGVNIDIIFTSCNAGISKPLTDSTVTQLRKGLEAEKYTGVRVQGAMGPSIKSDVTGTQYAVVDPNPARKGPAGVVEGKMFGVFRPKEKLAAWLKTPEGRAATIARRAEYAATISQLFYTQLTAELKDKGLLLDARRSMVAERTPGRSPKVGALIEKFEKLSRR